MDTDNTEWQKELEQEREYKDEFFRKGPKSPISSEDRTMFKGLVYYPPHGEYRFELDIIEHADKETLQIEDTKGHIRDFLRFGEFRFSIRNTEYALQAYKSDPQEGRLFIPFKDSTSGTETYGGGRYLDLEPENDLTSDGKWILDFNKAYNPWCAYSDNYACPFIPRENVIDAVIPAGEKKYPGSHQ